jgi:hypothetical protein
MVILSFFFVALPLCTNRAALVDLNESFPPALLNTH